MRIRTIKPEFWSSAKAAKVPREARLLFIGLWNLADDDGRLLGSPKKVAGALFEHDEDVDGRTVDAWLAQLEGARLIVRYDVKGTAYIAVSGFHEHQRIDKRWASRLPPPPGEGIAEPSAPLAQHRASLAQPPASLSGSCAPDMILSGNDSSSEIGNVSSSEVGSAAPAPLKPPPQAMVRSAPQQQTQPPEVLPPIKTVVQTLAPMVPQRPRNRSYFGQREREAEPQTTREYLARAYEYPHAPAKAGEETFGDVLRRDLVGPDGLVRGMGMKLEHALEATGWGHWQAQDALGRDRWIWPSQAPRRMEEWLREASAKAADLAAKTKLTHARAEANGIDLSKPATKQDPQRAQLVQVWRKRNGDGQDRLPPCETWVSEAIAQGPARIAEEVEWLRCRTLGIPATPQLGSGGPPRLPPSSSSVNQPPPPAPAADDVALGAPMTAEQRASREAAFAALSNLSAGMKPTASRQPRRPPAAGPPQKPLTKAELEEMRAHSPEARMLADEIERAQNGEARQ